jgi:2-desacetyl-2-hydroxyethyl bacteriochlorophyllide A dehydrogenase
MMKAIQIIQPGKYRLVEKPTPVPGTGDVLIKIAVTGICGTDIHIFNGEYEAGYPIIPGHEFSGTVVKVGNGVKYFKPGDRVTADPNIPCRRCPPCKRGYFNQCENLEAVGVTRDGAFAEYVVVPEQVVFSIDKIPFQDAAMIEPLACVMWGLKRVQAQPGDSALVFGAGPMGCLVIQALKCCGVSPIIVADKVKWRLDIVKELGATDIIFVPNTGQLATKLNISGYQIVVDATGVGQVLEDAFRYVQPRGKIWVFGVVPPTETVRFRPYDVFRKDLSIIGSFAVNQTFHEAIALITSGGIGVKPLISHQIPLERFDEAIRLVQSEPNRMKVQIQVS